MHFSKKLCFSNASWMNNMGLIKDFGKLSIFKIMEISGSLANYLQEIEFEKYRIIQDFLSQSGFIKTWTLFLLKKGID